MKFRFSHAGVCLSGLVALALLARPGDAELFERDWKEPGDGLLTYDNVNHREWLDLSQTLLEQFAETEAEFPEDHYANVIAELGPGGLLEGFSVATSEHVIALAESAGMDPMTSVYGVNSEPMSRLKELIDVTWVSQLGGTRSQGYLSDFGSIAENRRSAAIFHFSPPIPAFPSDEGEAGLLLVGGDDLFEPSTMGVFLYRTAVPEPKSFILGVFCIGVVAVAAQSRWRP